jgi:hypothetical protein
VKLKSSIREEQSPSNIHSKK